LLETFLLTLDGQAQTDEAGRIVARYLALRHPAGPLIRVLVRAVVREDASLPTYQMLEATVQQHQEWGDTEMRVMEVLADATNTIAEGEVMQLLHVHNADVRDGLSARDPIEDRQAVRGRRPPGRHSRRRSARAGGCAGGVWNAPGHCISAGG